MPKIIIIEGTQRGKSFTFADETVFIGRSLKSDIRINDSAISRKHLKIFRIGKKFFVEDLKSTNGTMVNGEMIAPGEGYEVSEHDTIYIGGTKIRLDDLPVKKLLEEKRLEAGAPKGVVNGEGFQRRDRRSLSSKNLELIYKVSELMRRSYGPRTFFEKILGYVMETFPRIDRAALLLFEDPKAEKKKIKDIVSQSRKPSGKEPFFYSRKVVEKVMTDGKPMRMSDMDYEGGDGFADDTKIMKIRSILCVPVISSSGVLGALYMDSIRRPYGFRKDDMMLLNGVSGYVAAVIEKESAPDRESPSR